MRTLRDAHSAVVSEIRALLIVVAASGVVGACATSTPTPVATGVKQPQTVTGDYRSLAITSATAPGVDVPSEDETRVIELVKKELTARAPGRFAFVDASSGLLTASAPLALASTDPPPSPLASASKALHMDILYTEFDAGNKFARFMLAGLGQIRIATKVTLSDAQTQEPIGTYGVSKQFAFGGIYGAVTSTADVEAGLAKGIAEILVPSK